MTVTLTGFFDVPEEALEEVRAALPEHVYLTRAEPGCEYFEVFESVSEPGRFAVSERFKDAASFRAHQDRAEASDWGRITRDYPRSYDIVGLNTVKDE
ncbi:putative quinol monooxygenase [Primorskyibacter sp. S87]|uniref:putative quinol monooxygenase n=1 Tax=Primorskyibacter sp. S87 TaxID=3415126 RepID=UPI003C7A333F